MKLSLLVAVMGWISTFVLAWLFILNIVQAYPNKFWWFIAFCMIAFIASVLQMEPKKGRLP